LLLLGIGILCSPFLILMVMHSASGTSDNGSRCDTAYDTSSHCSSSHGSHNNLLINFLLGLFICGSQVF
jgi:hypothetical protein